MTKVALFQMHINAKLLRLVVARSRRAEQAKTPEERKKAKAEDAFSGKAWGRVSPLHR